MFNPNQVLDGIDVSRPFRTFQGPAPSDDPEPAILLSQLMEVRTTPGRVLDLGCGASNKRTSFEFLGHTYVGIDVPGSRAEVIGDAHDLPFPDNDFDVVFSYAVFEHLYNPFVAIAEVARVLKPGGIFLGSV